MPVTTLSKFQRGQISSLEFGMYDFSGGLNVRDVPQMVPDNCLVQAYNGYISAQGGFQMRNGIAKYHTALSSGLPVLGLARFFQEVVNAVPQNPVVKFTLAETNGHLFNVEANTDLGAIGGTNALPWTWVRASTAHSNTPNVGLTDVMVICTGSGGPYIFDGTNLYSPSGWSAAAGARWCCIVNGVVWFGGIPATPRAIYGTGDGVNTDFRLLPAYNIFNMSNPVTGLCAMGEGATASLAVGMNEGLCLIYGTGPTNYMVQDIPCDGVVAGRTMVYYLGGLYYLGRAGFYTFSGQSDPQPVSDFVQPWFLNDTRVPGYPLATNRSAAYCQVYNNKIHLGYLSQQSSNSYPDTFLVYDLRVNGWTVLQATPGMYSATLLDSPDDPAPAQMLVGSGLNGQVYTWDVITTTPQDDGAPILVQMQTKYYKLGVPGTNKALTRLYPELFLAGLFTGQAILSTDYGLTSDIKVINASGTTPIQAMWDVSDWDQADWNGAGGNQYTPYVAPNSRIDYDNIQGDSFSFELYTNGSASAWVFGGLTGVFCQRGRT